MYYRRSEFLQHVKVVHHNIKSFVCNECDKTFSQFCDLKRHMRTHTKEKPFQCLVCDKRFTQCRDLKTLMRTHTNEKPFQCLVCDKRFTQKKKKWYSFDLTTNTMFTYNFLILKPTLELILNRNRFNDQLVINHLLKRLTVQAT